VSENGGFCQGGQQGPETPPWKISDREPPPVLAEIRFDFARADLTRARERILDDNLRLLKNYGLPGMRIEGHGDARGDHTYDDALAARRATRVRDYLVDRGYEADRLLVGAVGKRKPRCIAAEEGCWETNRRAEFRFNVLP
jgi:peptidoglycan-associated lipoprotein